MKGQQNADGPKMGPVGWGGKTLPHQNDTGGKLLKEILIYTIYNGVFVGKETCQSIYEYRTDFIY